MFSSLLVTLAFRTTPTTAEIIATVAEPIVQVVSAQEIVKPDWSSTSTVAAYIKAEADKIGVDSNLAQTISQCESGLRQFDVSGEVLRGKANPQDTGLFQINEKYHLKASIEQGYDIYTVDGNVAYALGLLKSEGSSPWSASKACWEKQLNN